MPWIVPLASAAYGIYQTAHAAHKKNQAEAALEKQAKDFQPNQSIMDYYGKALAKYNPNPYQTASYTQQNNQINRNLATGINATQNRRLGVGAIGGLVQQANDASARAAGNAETQNRQDLGLLGSAAGAKTNEQQKKFDMLYNLTAMKAGASAQTENSGIQNIFSGLSSAAYMYQPKTNPYKSDLNWGDISYAPHTRNYMPALNSYRQN